MLVKDIGEFGLIRRLTKDMTAEDGVVVGPGDDTAVVETTQDKYLLLTCDCMVEGVHFLPGAEPENVGYKLLAGNISDVASMGGLPKHALVTLILPPDTPVGWVEGLYKGLMECGREYGVGVVGGDVSQGRQIALNLCLTGEVRTGRQLLRSKACPGDLVLVTGALGLGAALAGLHVLTNRVSLDDTLRDEALSRHLKPRPRVNIGHLLGEIGCKCANDISDGLASECWEIAEASGVSIVLDIPQIPIAPSARAAASNQEEDPVLYALSSGEEYELLFCLSPHLWEMNKEALPDCSVIGEVVAGQGVFLCTPTGLSEVARKGWVHF